MKCLFTGLFLLLVCISNAKEPKLSRIDSLEHKLKSTQKGVDKIKLLIKLLNYYQSINPKKAIAYGEMGLSIARDLKRDSDICTFYGYTGETYFYSGDYRNGVKLCSNEYDLAAKRGYKKLMAASLSDLGACYQYQGYYTQSQAYFFKAIKVAEEIKNKVLEILCYTNICVNYSNENNFDKTIFYAKKILALSKSVKMYVFPGKANELTGSAYVYKRDFRTARAYYNRALSIYETNKDTAGIATICTLLVSAYETDYQKKLELGLRSQQIWDKIGPKNIYALNNLGNLGITYGQIARFKKQGSESKNALFSKAEFYLEKCISISSETNSRQNVMEFSDSLANVEAAEGKYKDAFNNRTIHNRLYDSIYSQENKNKIASLEGKHEIELRDKQLLINRLEIAGQQKQRWFLIGGLIMLLLIAGLIYNQSNQRKKANAALSLLNTQLDEANKVKTRFFSILNHDLRSPIASFVNFLHLQQQAPDLMDEAAKADYSKKATIAAENLLDTMEDLLLWSKGQMEHFKPYLKPIPVETLFHELESPAFGTRVQISFQQPAGMILNTDEHYIKTILHNLTNNAIKALKNSPEGIVEWKAWESNSGKYLSITDNGPGASEEKLKPLYDDSAPIGIKNGLGLHIVRDLAKAIGCYISVSSAAVGSGVEITLKFNDIPA